MLHGSTSSSATTRLVINGLRPRHRRGRWNGIRPPPFTSSRSLLTLAIETSCDDTCVAILEKRSHLDKSNTCGSSTANSTSHDVANDSPLAKLHFHEKVTARNTGLGGIHPLEALESHRANLSDLISKSLGFLPLSHGREGGFDKKIVGHDGLLRRKPDFVTVTRGPGMRSNLSCGLDIAKGLAVAWSIPLLGVHHMQAHALTPRLVDALTQKNEGKGGRDRLQPGFPFLTLLVSGGHTMLLHSTELNTHKILATTADVAIGDALDKAGRLLLPDDIKTSITKDTAYAKYLSEYAFPTPDDFKHWHVPKRRGEEITRPVNEFGWQMHAPFAQTRDLIFSFASIATRPEKIVQGRISSGGSLTSTERLLLARTVMGTAFEHLGSRIVIALESLKEDGVSISTLVVSGGVAANDFLRYFLRSMLDARGFGSVELVFPPVALCTDNAAMIAWTGMEMYEAGFRSKLGIAALKKWSMDAKSEDGGVLGVGGWTQVAA